MVRGTDAFTLPDVIIESAAGEQLYAITLSWHPYGDRLYAFGAPTSRQGVSMQRWNPISERWEPAVEGSLRQIDSARAVFPHVLIAVLIVGVLAGVLRRNSQSRPWLLGMVAPLGVAVVVLSCLMFVPITWHGSVIQTAAFSPDGSMLATSSWNENGSLLCVWDATTGAGLEKLDVPFDSIASLEFSADGERIQVQGHGENRLVWELNAEP